MSSILLDTQALIWLVEGNPKLSAVARRLCEASLKRQSLSVSAVSYWEIAYLERSGKIKLGLSMTAWREWVLRSGIAEVPLTAGMAIRAAEILDAHRDPFDRFILASAEAHGAALMTSDHVLLQWRGGVKRHDARE